MLLRRLSLLWYVILLSGFSIEHLFLSYTTVWLFNEPRPIVSMMEDISITHHLSKKLSDDLRYDRITNIALTSYNQTVLLAGQVPTKELKQQAGDYALHTPKVKHILNQLTINPPTGAWQRMQDTYLAVYIRAKLLMTSNIRYHHFLIMIENGEVFILGKASSTEAKLAISVIQNTTGVKQITKWIEPN